jgi:hypothetical protein
MTPDKPEAETVPEVKAEVVKPFQYGGRRGLRARMIATGKVYKLPPSKEDKSVTTVGTRLMLTKAEFRKKQPPHKDILQAMRMDPAALASGEERAKILAAQRRLRQAIRSLECARKTRHGADLRRANLERLRAKVRKASAALRKVLSTGPAAVRLDPAALKGVVAEATQTEAAQ